MQSKKNINKGKFKSKNILHKVVVTSIFFNLFYRRLPERAYTGIFQNGFNRFNFPFTMVFWDSFHLSQGVRAYNLHTPPCIPPWYSDYTSPCIRPWYSAIPHPVYAPGTPTIPHPVYAPGTPPYPTLYTPLVLRHTPP